jgi:hypothetical protein
MQAHGFDMEKAVEAYFLCNRNEEQAINCLMANPDGIGNSGSVSLLIPCLIGPLILSHFKAVRQEPPGQVPNHATSRRTVPKFTPTLEDAMAVKRVGAITPNAWPKSEVLTLILSR